MVARALQDQGQSEQAGRFLSAVMAVARELQQSLCARWTGTMIVWQRHRVRIVVTPCRGTGLLHQWGRTEIVYPALSVVYCPAPYRPSGEQAGAGTACSAAGIATAPPIASKRRSTPPRIHTCVIWNARRQLLCLSRAAVVCRAWLQPWPFMAAPALRFRPAPSGPYHRCRLARRLLARPSHGRRAPYGRFMGWAAFWPAWCLGAAHRQHQIRA